ncbi:hypothetical protein POL68_30710 [Stigmatella sp. ncwal1]|uniref:Uncharacterized protein n=1 Tax=Stigmatella ashevillensis TaxID=2995309 RepID=A0ABT5DIB2_9BACT|nr:hypothetical protein [Stigmatella ashevillena]MDC0712873.1 hypothetical protein [Stigmatella ashevillena]
MLSCLLVLEVLLAAPPAGEPLQWQVPGQVSTVEVPGGMNVGGIPIRLQVYTSKESVDRLLQYFATAFDESGFYIERQQKQLAAEPHLTALNTRTLTSYTVILEKEASGLTTVVLGEAKMGEFKPLPASELLPVYPGAQSVLQGDFEGAKTLAFRVEAKEAQVSAWYRERLLRAGYKEEGPLVFRRQEQEVRLSAAVREGALDVVLFLKTAGERPLLEPEAVSHSAP